MQRIILFFIFALLPLFSWAAKETYRIQIVIKGFSEPSLIMGNYYANGTYALDTAFIDSKGRYIFSSTVDTLYPGLYFFTTGTGKYVEFVVYNEAPFFSFETSDDDWLMNMKVRGSLENETFYNFHRLNAQVAKLNPAPVHADSASYAAYMMKQSLIMDSLKRDFIQRNPNRFISKMMLSTKEVPVPMVDDSGRELEPRERWEYFASHYFDNMPLDDDMLVRTPEAVFYQRIMSYFDQYMHGAPPETIIPYLDTLLDRARSSRENFRYLLHTLTEKYLQSNIMVYDAIYVHLILRYYATGAAWWMTPSGIESEVERAERWDKLLVGRTAPELILFDTLHNPHSLHSLQAKYKLLVFWSPSCGHCQTVIPQLYERFDRLKKKYDIQGFAILSEPDDTTRPKWRKFINEHHLDWLNLDGGEANVDWHQVYDITSTPQIYLLDDQNVILAKKLGAESFEQILEAVEASKSNDK